MRVLRSAAFLRSHPTASRPVRILAPQTHLPTRTHRTMGKTRGLCTRTHDGYGYGYGSVLKYPRVYPCRSLTAPVSPRNSAVYCIVMLAMFIADCFSSHSTILLTSFTYTHGTTLTQADDQHLQQVQCTRQVHTTLGRGSQNIQVRRMFDHPGMEMEVREQHQEMAVRRGGFRLCLLHRHCNGKIPYRLLGGRGMTRIKYRTKWK